MAATITVRVAQLPTARHPHKTYVPAQGTPWRSAAHPWLRLAVTWDVADPQFCVMIEVNSGYRLAPIKRLTYEELVTDIEAFLRKRTRAELQDAVLKGCGLL